MSSNRTLCHYTITTGHVRRSPRSEVGDDVISVLVPLLAPGEHAIPRTPGYRVRVTIDRGVYAATVLSDRRADAAGAPLVTIMVATDPEGLDAIRRTTGAHWAAAIELPACIVEAHATLGLDRDAIGWLGDFERCLAWAWVERGRS